MEYRCGHCGQALTEPELDGGVCPHCGAQISPFGDVVQPPPKPPIASDWPRTFLEPTVEAPPVKTKVPTRSLEDPGERLNVIRTSRTTGRLAPLTPSDPTPPGRGATTGLMLGIGIAVALVLACTIAATGTLLNGLASAKIAPATPIVKKAPTLAPTATYGGLGFPTQPPDATPLPFTGQIPTPEPTSTPYGGIPTPTPLPTVAGPGRLGVTPPVWAGHCDKKTLPAFQLANVGGGQINWTAASGDAGVAFGPTSGTLVSGAPPTVVQVTAPVAHGSITFTDTTDPGAPPVVVQFLCN